MNLNLDESFRKVITQSGLPLAQFAKATQTSALQTLKWWSKEESVFLTDLQISNFENYFAIPVKSITGENPNIDLLRKRIFGEISSLPEKYEIGANSYVRSSYYIIQYLSLLFGKEYTDRLLTSLEVHPDYLNDLNRKINVRFIRDLLTVCKNLNFKNIEFSNLANSLFMSVDNTPTENLFKNVQNYEEFYYQFETSTSHFDKNFIYDFIIGKNGVDIITKPSEDLNYLIKAKNIDISILFEYRPLLFAHAPALSQLETLSVEVKSCISRGDRFSRYRIPFITKQISVL